VHPQTSVAAVAQTAPTAADAKMDELFPGTGDGAFPEFAGMTCKGYYSSGYAEMAQGAIWFKTVSNGDVNLFGLPGRPALENFDKVSSPNGYNHRGRLKMTRRGNEVMFTAYNGIVYHLTPVGHGQYDLLMTWNNGDGPWRGKVMCNY
jgi:hypothetical protein